MKNQEMVSFMGLKKEMKVEHNLLGKGTIVDISSTNSEAVLVHFDNYKGNAQWMLDSTLQKSNK